MGTKPRVLVALPLLLPGLANPHLLVRSYQDIRTFTTELTLLDLILGDGGEQQ